MKNKPIKLCNADLTKDIFKDVMFFSIAGSGAMGEPGESCFTRKAESFIILIMSMEMWILRR